MSVTGFTCCETPLPQPYPWDVIFSADDRHLLVGDLYQGFFTIETLQRCHEMETHAESAYDRHWSDDPKHYGGGA